MDAGGRAAMLYDLLAYDYAAVNLRAAPETEALRQQKVLSLQPAERWIFDKLMSGRWLPDHEGWRTVVVKDTLHDDYVGSLVKIGVTRRSSKTELGMFIKRVFPAAHAKCLTIEGRRQGCWTFPELDACRARFDEFTHSRHPWD